nr:YkgJ family cysteine cluster protein [Desulfobulbaceae bacterium]
MSDQNNSVKEKVLFGTDKNPTNIEPEKLTLDSKIQFRCHPGVSCFTACCGNINIVLTPYDILCLRKRIGIDSDEFLLRYTKPFYLEKTDMPGVQIHLTEEGRCPFVTDEGCLVYTDRPSACRYYPIGMANFHERSENPEDDPKESERFFFKVKESYCKGHEEDKHWTVREWRADQGVDYRDDINRPWMELVMRRKSFGHQATLSEQAQKMFFMASTNLEKFKDFIFKSSFLDTYEIDQETLDKIKNDDIELLKFSYLYLASSLFGTNDLKIRDEKLQAKIAAMQEKQGSAEANAEETYKALLKDRDDLQKTFENQKKK